MGKKKRSGGGMSQVRKWAKRALSGVRVAVIGFTASHGLISAGVRHIGAGDYQGFPAGVVRDYTGISITGSGIAFEQDQAIKSVLTIGGGLLTAWLIGIGIKHI